MAVVLAAAGGDNEPTALGRRMLPAAGPGSARILGRHRWAAAGAGDIGLDSHLRGVAAGVVAICASPTCPTWSTTLCACVHRVRTRAARRTRSWSASGRAGERRRRCWRTRHPAAGSHSRRIVDDGVAAAAAAAVAVAAAAEAASGHVGSRPWRLSKLACQLMKWAAFLLRFVLIPRQDSGRSAVDSRQSDGRGRLQGWNCMQKWRRDELTRISAPTARQLPPTLKSTRSCSPGVRPVIEEREEKKADSVGGRNGRYRCSLSSSTAGMLDGREAEDGCGGARRMFPVSRAAGDVIGQCVWFGSLAP